MKELFPIPFHSNLLLFSFISSLSSLSSLFPNKSRASAHDFVQGEGRAVGNEVAHQTTSSRMNSFSAPSQFALPLCSPANCVLFRLCFLQLRRKAWRRPACALPATPTLSAPSSLRCLCSTPRYPSKSDAKAVTWSWTRRSNRA